MSLVFVSYRRIDSGASAGRLYDQLVREFGKKRVFMDVEGSIAHGADFPSEIERAIAASSALLVVIGRHWLTCTDESGNRRIDNDDDWVASEVAAALSRNIFILPVLVDGATMPPEGLLPARIAALSRRQACEIRLSSWEFDVGRIVKTLRPRLRTRSWKTRRAMAIAAVAGAIALALLVSRGALFNTRDQGEVAPTPDDHPAIVPAPANGTGQIGLEWGGANSVEWIVVDADNQTVDEGVAEAGSTSRLSAPTGDYFVVLKALPEFHRLPVTVAAGQTTTLTPVVGRLELTWNGATATSAHVLDEKGSRVRERLAIPPRGMRVVDLKPGTYSVVLPGSPPRRVVVAASRTIELKLEPEPPRPPSPAVPASPFVRGQWSLPSDDLWGFVEIPAGPFVMGSDKTRDGGALQDELPQHRLTLHAFFVGRYEVTVDQYKACVEDGGCKPGNAAALEGAVFEPVRFVSWNEATAYGGWLGRKLRSSTDTPGRLAAALSGGRDGRQWQVRLPTEAEWERAARGSEGRIYPWGERLDASRANYADSRIGRPTPVGRYSSGVSPHGLFDMSGNVWEWTRSRERRYPYDLKNEREDARGDDNTIRVIRGGSFQSADVRGAIRNTGRQGERNYFTGFRVVIAPPP